MGETNIDHSDPHGMKSKTESSKCSLGSCRRYISKKISPLKNLGERSYYLR